MIFNYLSLKFGQRSSAQRSLAITLLCSLFFISQIHAQKPHCHSDELLSDYLDSHAHQHEIKQYKIDLENQINSRSGGSVIVLPVVFHVIHRGEALGQGSNLTDAKIMEQLNTLNTDFAYQNTDKNQIPAQFTGAAADTEIQFCLAQIDENGQSTSGIVRHELGTVSSVNTIENIIKPMTQWDSDKYINIWIARMPDPSILGYAYLPVQSIIGTARDGIVISHLKIGNQNTSTRGRTLVHEMGHYLGLLHMWGFEENDCDEDDQVSDTPATFAPNYGCPAHPQFTCGSADMFMNYMDYVDDNCMFMFTEGQKNIMHGTLNNQRFSLVNNNTTSCSTSVSTSEERITEPSLEVYPNPCTAYINVDINTDNDIVSYQIYNLGGMLVQEVASLKSTMYDTFEIPTASLPNGAYVIRFATKSGISITKRFVKHIN